MTEIRTTGVYVIGECNLQLPKCTALDPAPITVVKLQPSGKQVNVCSTCLQEMLNRQEWFLAGAGLSAQYDFVLMSKVGKPLLVLEVKRPPAATGLDEAVWAQAFARNLAAHDTVRPALLILALLDGNTYFFRLSEPGVDLISTIETNQAFNDLGLQEPLEGIDERFAESFFANFIEKLVTVGLSHELPWVSPLRLEKLQLSGATMRTRYALSA